jgi:serine/threonine-protein phosphatase PPG1
VVLGGPTYARMHNLDLDDCIEKLKRRELLREEILEAICDKVKEVLMRESNVLHVSAPITVVGDIHGFYFLSSLGSCLLMLI